MKKGSMMLQLVVTCNDLEWIWAQHWITRLIDQLGTCIKSIAENFIPVCHDGTLQRLFIYLGDVTKKPSRQRYLTQFLGQWPSGFVHLELCMPAPTLLQISDFNPSHYYPFYFPLHWHSAIDSSSFQVLMALFPALILFRNLLMWCNKQSFY